MVTIKIIIPKVFGVVIFQSNSYEEALNYLNELEHLYKEVDWWFV